MLFVLWHLEGNAEELFSESYTVSLRSGSGKKNIILYAIFVRLKAGLDDFRGLFQPK